MRKRGAEIGVVAQRIGQRDAVQIAGIFVPGLQPGDQRGVARPEKRVVPRGQMARERGAPGAGAEDGYFHTQHRSVVACQFSAVPFGAPAAPACC